MQCVCGTCALVQELMHVCDQGRTHSVLLEEDVFHRFRQAQDVLVLQYKAQVP